MTDLTPAAIAEGERPGTPDLVPFGWAPGNYMFRCANCTDAQNEAGMKFRGGRFAAKGAYRCREHALDAALLTAARDAARYREALELIWPFFEGEHFYDHPDSVKVRKILADLAGEREGE